ncbi:quinone oxidoreductase family protein [Govanella unica]|uniref:Quinone oxidoreductase n=1 Tax=Govanella unica TaxID=2975056 RepID=A0A9X3TVA5_9PROT|nr:quinone oxidoreductase [Govania unica]MDA5192383.1 quinone oxidoreductase [Govania unica]
MTRTVRITQAGGPEVLTFVDLPLEDPASGQVRLRQTAIGLNFIDIYHRSGVYPLPLPSALGLEAAGVVEAVGPNVTDLKVGDRVAYGVGPLGGYADARLIAADRVVKLPQDIDDTRAAGMMLKGLTAQYLLRRTYRVKAGDTILFHAAAGGVGLIACQWAKSLGATVIGTVGSDEKAELARKHGCDHVIVYTRENFTDRVREITDGKGVPVVYDSVGKSTFDGSLDCLSPLGLMVTYGNATGLVPPVDPQILSTKGGLFLTRPTIMAYMAKNQDLTASANELFEVVQSGKVKIEVNQTWSLADVADAHRALEARKTTGSSVLLP